MFPEKESFLKSNTYWSLLFNAKAALLPHGIRRFWSLLQPLSHWTATVLRQLATDIASGSQSSLETVGSDWLFPRMCRQVAQSSRENFEHVQNINAKKIPRKMVAQSSRVSRKRRELVADPLQFNRNLLEHDKFAR